MPRKDAGHTGQASRNPAGRPVKYDGKRAQTAYLITAEARDQARQLAAFARVPIGEFVETLIRKFGMTCAAELLQGDQTSAEPIASGDPVAGGSVGTEAVPAD